MGMNGRYFFESNSYEFEADMVDVITTFAKREWGVKSVKFSTRKQDLFEGTDLFVVGIPIDVTMNFAQKNNTQKLGEMDVDGISIDFGVRIGNGNVDFKTPVLVLGVESAAGIGRSNLWVVIETVKSNIKEILNKGMDKYLYATE